MFNPASSPSAIVDLVQPKPEWDVLSITSGTNSIAQELAPYVGHITRIRCNQTITQNTLEALAKSDQAIDILKSEQLLYGPDQFNLLLYDQCSHLLSNIEEWLQEVGRILCPQGLIILRTHLVPGTRLRGKKARRLREAGIFINAFCQLQNSQHKRFYSQNRWEDLLMESGFEIKHMETSDKIIDFTAWVNDSSLSLNDRLRLKAMLIQAPEKAREFLTPEFSGDRIRFRLPEITILATKQAKRF